MLLENFFGFGITSLYGPQNSYHFLSRSDSLLKPITTCSPAFSRALDILLDFSLSSHWLFNVLSFLLIGRCNYFGFNLRHSIEKRSIYQQIYKNVNGIPKSYLHLVKPSCPSLDSPSVCCRVCTTMSEPVTIYARVGRVRGNMKNQGFNDCRYIKIIHVHCGEETSVRDPGSYKHYWASRFFSVAKGRDFLSYLIKK